jgi:hypothetical protein
MAGLKKPQLWLTLAIAPIGFGAMSTIRQQSALTLIDSQAVWANTRPNIHIDD